MQFRALVGVVAGLWLLVVSPPARASAPELLNYQGILTLGTGQMVPDGSYTLTFRVWGHPTSTAPAYKKFEQANVVVQVKDGLYNVLLSGTNQLAAAFDSTEPRFMEVTIETATPAPGFTVPVVLQPRQQIASVPYALSARTAGMVTGGTPPPPADSVPRGAIILWVESNECPPGYEQMDGEHVAGGRALDMRTRGVRGADTNAADPNIVDAAGVTGGNMLGGGDTLSVAQLAAHAHTYAQTLNGAGGFETGSGAGEQTGGTSSEGGSAPHIHKYTSVLFCRRI